MACVIQSSRSPDGDVEQTRSSERIIILIICPQDDEKCEAWENFSEFRRCRTYVGDTTTGATY